MSAVVQLQLVGVTPADADSRSPEEQVFDHWVWVMGKRPGRTVLGPERRRVLRRALELYDVETLKLAIDGCATSPFHAGENDRATPYRDLELIVRSERTVERFAEMGEEAHEKARQALRRRREAAQAAAAAAREQAASAASGGPGQPLPDGAAVAEDEAQWRELVRAKAAALASRHSRQG